MRRERIRRNRRTLYLTLAGIGAIILFIGVFIWLVLRELRFKDLSLPLQAVAHHPPRQSPSLLKAGLIPLLAMSRTKTVFITILLFM